MDSRDPRVRTNPKEKQVRVSVSGSGLWTGLGLRAQFQLKKNESVTFFTCHTIKGKAEKYKQRVLLLCCSKRDSEWLLVFTCVKDAGDLR